MSEIVLSKNENNGNSPVYVKRSLVLDGSESNTLAVQLHNGTDFIVNGVNLRVEYLDREGGSVYSTKEISVKGLMGMPGTDFILPDIGVPKSRKAVNVKLYAVISGEFFYRLSEDGRIESEVCMQKTDDVTDDITVIKTKKKFAIIFALALAIMFLISFAVALPGLLIGDAAVEDVAYYTCVIGEKDAETR